MTVIVAALLSAIHVLTLAVGLGAVAARGRALAAPLDDAGWRRLLMADNLWGAAAGLWIVSGLARIFYGGREAAFYWRNGFLLDEDAAVRRRLHPGAGADDDVHPRTRRAPRRPVPVSGLEYP